MQIINTNSKQILATNAKIAISFSDQVLGLLNKSNPRALVIRTRWGIHTFGLKKPIDILILDKSYKVVKIKKLLNPNRIFIWNPKYYLAVELPCNSIVKTNIGDKIKMD